MTSQQDSAGPDSSDVAAPDTSAAPAPEVLAPPEPQTSDIDQVLAQEKQKWDEEHKQELNRYRAAQRKEQELSRQLTQLQQQMAFNQQELEGYRRQARTAQLDNLDPETRQHAEKAIVAEDQLREARAELARRQAQMETMARPLVMQQIAQDSGIPIEELEDCIDPMEMQKKAMAYVKAELEKAKKAAPSEKKQGQPFASGGGASAPTFDKRKFDGSGDLVGFLKAKREAGER